LVACGCGEAELEGLALVGAGPLQCGQGAGGGESQASPHNPQSTPLISRLRARSPAGVEIPDPPAPPGSLPARRVHFGGRGRGGGATRCVCGAAPRTPVQGLAGCGVPPATSLTDVVLACHSTEWHQGMTLQTARVSLLIPTRSHRVVRRRYPRLLHHRRLLPHLRWCRS